LCHVNCRWLKLSLRPIVHQLDSELLAIWRTRVVCACYNVITWCIPFWCYIAQLNFAKTLFFDITRSFTHHFNEYAYYVWRLYFKFLLCFVVMLKTFSVEDKVNFRCQTVYIEQILWLPKKTNNTNSTKSC